MIFKKLGFISDNGISKGVIREISFVLWIWRKYCHIDITNPSDNCFFEWNTVQSRLYCHEFLTGLHKDIYMS